VLRHLKLHSIPGHEKIIAFTDGLYLANPDSLINPVKHSEKALKDPLVKAGEKKKYF